MKIIDLDSHVEPRTEDYVIEPEYAHLRPRIYTDAKGTIRAVFNNRVTLMLTRGELTGSDREKKLARRAAHYDASMRYHLVKGAGIDFQFVFNAGVTRFSYMDARAGAAFCKAYNDSIYNTFMKSYPETFSGIPQLPLQDVRLALEEFERCVNELGMLGLMIPSNWNGVDMADPHWWNFYDRVRQLEITGIIVHIDSLSRNPWVGKERLGILGPDGATGKRIVSQPFEYCTMIINLIFGGMMDSFPEFRFAFLEAGAEFAIVLKHRIEENLEQIGYLREMLAHPLDWYFDRFYFLMDDRMLENKSKILRYAIEELGADHLFFGSDFPHLDGDLGTAARVKELDGLSTDMQEKILGQNALTLMGGKLG